ncbi:hypothetical protein CL614_10415 [archaeon]|nr:hypothetical protein [archaeon]|tara:strand:+ start:1878 stop:2207 length:330 start_codon:yes stop_codon:yes gene_type:complete
MAQKLNIIIDQGSDYTLDYTVVEANGSLMDITSNTSRASMRKHFDSTTSLDFTVVVDSGNNKITLTMTNAYTANTTPGRYYWDAEVVSNTNYVTRVVEGIATITPEVTR